MPSVIKERIPRKTKRQNQQRVMRNWSGILIAQSNGQERLYRGTMLKKEETIVIEGPHKRHSPKGTKSNHD